MWRRGIAKTLRGVTRLPTWRGLSTSTTSSSTTLPEVMITTVRNQSKTDSSSLETSSMVKDVKKIVEMTEEEAMEKEKAMFSLRRKMAAAYNSQLYDEALAAATELAQNIQDTYGEETTVYASALNNVALMHKSAGDLDVAADGYRRSLEIYGRTAGEGSVPWAMTAANLGKMYKDSAALLPNDSTEMIAGYTRTELIDQADSLLTSALTTREKLFGKNDKSVIETRAFLASVMVLRDDLDQAVKELVSLVSLTRSLYGEDCNLLGLLLNNLGFTLKTQGLLPEAGDAYLQAYRLQEKVFGAKSAQAQLTIRNLEALEAAFQSSENSTEQLVDVNDKADRNVVVRSIIQKELSETLAKNNSSENLKPKEEDDFNLGFGPSSNSAPPKTVANPPRRGAAQPVTRKKR